MSNNPRHTPGRAELAAPPSSLSRASPPSLWLLLRVWLLLGAQSFGGGAATLFLIRRAVVERHGWLTDEEFTRYWAICQVAPGINLLGLTVLIGWRLAGVPGIALSLLGLLLPSVSITVLLTATYTHIRDLEIVQAALRGLIPATVGVGFLLSFQMGRPLIRASWREGYGSFALSWAILLASGVAVALRLVSVIVILCTAGTILAVVALIRSAVRERRETG